MRSPNAARALYLLVCLLTPRAGLGETDPERLEIQSASEHAYIMTKSGTITDKEFARWMGSLLAPEGQIRVHSATFIFQECFGGGMLDDLKGRFGRGVRWIGGSASKHNERAIGKLTQAEAAARRADAKTPSQFITVTPRSTWSEVLVPGIASGQVILEAIGAANETDIVGPKAAAPYIGLENPQWASGSGGELNVLVEQDEQVQTRRAVLWAGQGNRWRHYNNIKAVRDMLVEQWGAAAGTYAIVVFYGNGLHAPNGSALPEDWHARPGTAEGLRIFLRTQWEPLMTDTTQFFFYATGHGGSSKKLPPPPAVLSPGTVDNEQFELSPAELDLLAGEPDNEPLMAITYEDYLPGSGEATVTLNGVLLGTIPPVTEPGEAIAHFTVSESLLASVNTLVVSNNSDVDLNVTDSGFVTGAIDDDPPLVRADLDGDGDVDSDDFTIFQLCATGPSVGYWPNLPAGCTLVANESHLIASDLDRDEDVDQDDFSAFQRCISGGGVFANPACAF